jgi:COMPASS component SWD3
LVGEANPPVGSVRFTPNGQFLSVATLDGTIRLWDSLKRTVQREFKSHVNERYCLFHVVGMRNDETTMVICGSEDHDVYVWDLQSEKVIARLSGHQGMSFPKDPTL